MGVGDEDDHYNETDDLISKMHGNSHELSVVYPVQGDGNNDIGNSAMLAL